MDLIHSVGFFDPVIQSDLKSRDGLERLLAFRKILSERDRFAMELGFEQHYAQVLRDLEVPFPSGFNGEGRLAEKLQALEDHLMDNAQVIEDVHSRKVIRHLSFTESPFRSCLGGSDCSSRSYFDKALDPNYHYFTLTDDGGNSSGHITVVLGRAESRGQEEKVAFVDKIQNVNNEDIAMMIEGVRRSVEEKGYSLVLPKGLGDHNGISNSGATRHFIQKNIAVDKTQLLENFLPPSSLSVCFGIFPGRSGSPHASHPPLAVVGEGGRFT